MEGLSGSPLLELEAAQLEVPPNLQDFLFSLPKSVAIRLPGRDQRRTRAVVGMLHGNEPSGLAAVHQLLRSRPAPLTNVLIVIGAVRAAKLPPVFSHRFLPGQRDLNRCFYGPRDDEEGLLAAAILSTLRRYSPEAVIDLHNNSGHNPAYGVSTRLDPMRIGLASLFAPRFVLSRLGLGALMDALEDEFPITTIECGRRLDPAADACAYAGLRRFIQAEELPRVAANSGRVDVLHRAVRVRVRPNLRIGFDDHRQSGTDITCALDIDRHNFQSIPKGSHLAWVSDEIEWPFDARDESGAEVSQKFFRREGRSIRTTRPFIPIMMTTDVAIALSDCLFYAVERW